MAGDFTKPHKLGKQDDVGGVQSHPSSNGYMEKVSDEELVAMIEQGVQNSVGDFLNSSDLARERQKATWEYAMKPLGHLVPNGVSSIVSSDTVEVIDGYTAVIGKLMFGNKKIARFIPNKKTPTEAHNAKLASDVVNHIIFKENSGWEILNTWIKASLLWKNAIIKWSYLENFDYEFEEYDEISPEKLNLILGNDDIELCPGYEVKTKPDESGQDMEYYCDVRLRRKIDKSGIKLSVVEPESFRITRDANNLDDAAFVGIQMNLTRSDIRKYWPEIAEEIDWDQIGEGSIDWATKYTEEEAARKRAVGEEYWIGANRKELYPLEANREITCIECWIRVDRDGDGIAELKHFIIAGGAILHEEDCSRIPMASICPFEVPHEFFGLSMADMVRPSTLATTAILRGFLENVYLTNYSPKLADPNVVDFSALQNMKPKQIIATNGNPTQAVFNMPPESISQGTVPMLEMLQLHKEQATGLSKAAQGLNDTLYVSGNSEEKVSAVQSAAQVRIESIARRFAETGFARLISGVYAEAKKHMRMCNYLDERNEWMEVDMAELPHSMHVIVDIDVGDHSNSNTLKKMQIIGQQVLPALMSSGAGGVVAPEAAANIAAKTICALDLDPLDFIVDYTTDEFKQKAMQDRQKQQEMVMKQQQLEEEKARTEIEQLKANVAFTNADVQNNLQDNLRELYDAIDTSDREWAKITVDLLKEGLKTGITDDEALLKMIPPRRSTQELIMLSGSLVGTGQGMGQAMQPGAEVKSQGVPAAGENMLQPQG